MLKIKKTILEAENSNNRFLPPGITMPQSCNVNAVSEPSLSTRTTP